MQATGMATLCRCYEAAAGFIHTVSPVVHLTRLHRHRASFRWGGIRVRPTCGANLLLDQQGQDGIHSNAPPSISAWRARFSRDLNVPHGMRSSAASVS